MITIFTPTYNRAYILHRLYNSLIKQTNKNFEWIIVDDGSTDNTSELIEKWIKEKKVNIRYYWQTNQGKPAAHNLGTQKANGELFVCVDSDDYVTENAVDVIEKKWKEIENYGDCTGIVGTRITQQGKPVGTYMPANIKYSTLDDLYNKYKYKGDTILIFKTDIIKKFRFPKIEGEKFIPETYLYDQIDQEGKLAIINDGIYVCEYLNDGYTANVVKLIKNNPNGYALYAEQHMNYTKTKKEKLKAASKYVLGNWLAHNKGYVKRSSKKLLTIISMPFAFWVYIKKYK